MNRYKLGGIALLMLATTSCGGNSSKEDERHKQDSIMLYQTREELQATLAVQDSLFALINEIGSDMAQIRQMESLAAAPANLSGESNSRRDQMKTDIALISQALQKRRQRIAEIEKKLRDSNNQNTTMLSTIETLKAQLADQEKELTTLREQIAQANATIADLNSTVDTLTVSLSDERQNREQAEAKATALTDELNTGYYAIGSKKELEKNNIIKTGFLRKTKIMQGDYELSYFTRIDKRNFHSLQLHSKKAKMMSNQPADSYEITDGAGGQKVLVIKDAKRFWSTSNFIVIQID